jgi:YfiH family protein
MTILKPLTSEHLSAMPGLRHAFFTREGGVSEGIFAALNVGLGSGDDPAHVRENRRRAATSLAVAENGLVTAYQIHSAKVVVVEQPWKPGQAPQVDALVTRQRGVALGILTADCAPILFADTKSGVIGAAHAGWKGAIGGVIEATVEAMTKLGAKPARITAAIGPCIAQDSYEVGPEFPAPFVAEDPTNGRHFRPDRNAEGEPRWRFDLAGYVSDKLERLGLAAVETLPYDTCADDRHFFSYRRACLRGEKDYGRGLSAIALAD